MSQSIHQPKEDVQWPPISPQDVLRLTPKKRKNAHIGGPPSSPLRHSTISPTRSPSKFRPLGLDGGGDASSSDEDDDEEYLRLKLARIEAKLKLKELEKKKKAKGREKENRIDDNGRKTPPPLPQSLIPEVQVPVSPSPRKDVNKEAPQSPSRVLLGIDKGLRAKDISLRRAPGYSITKAPPKPQFTAAAAAALRNATTTTTSTNNNTATASNGNRSDKKSTRNLEDDDPFTSSAAANSRSFAQRILDQRSNIKEKEEKEKLNDKSRTKSWDVAKTNGNAASTNPTLSKESQPVSRSTSVSLKTMRAPGVSEQKHSNAPPISILTQSKPSEEESDPKENSEENTASFETFSSFHLSRRIIPHTTLARHLSNKSVFLIPDLLKSVVSPDFDPPDTPGDWVVMGVICSKSEPREVAREGAGKYLVMQLTDFKWELELFLFGSSFEKFYKLPVGMVIALLNPGIMKPRVKDTGRFSVTLSDSSDAVLEVGNSRDLGSCKAKKKDGKDCGTWVDKRHSEFCSFHVELSINKQRTKRMEVNTITRMYSPPKRGQSMRGRGGGGGGGGGWRGKSSNNGGASFKDDGLLPEGPMLDVPQRSGGAGGKVFVSAVSSAHRIDGDNSNDPFNNGNKAERLRKQLAISERERNLTKRLVASHTSGSNTGMDYLRQGVDKEDEPSESRAFGSVLSRSIGFDPSRKPGSLNRNNPSESTSSVVENFRSSSGQISAANVSLSPIRSILAKRKSGGQDDLLIHSSSSMRGPPSKRSRQTDEPIGWGHKNVKEYVNSSLDRNVRARSHSPSKDVGGGGLKQGTINFGGLPAQKKKESKSVKFAPTPTVESEDDDDLEITDWMQ